MEDARCMTEKEAAEYMSVTPMALRSLRRRNLVPYVRIATRTIRYSEADIKEFLEKKKFKFTK